MNFGDQGSFLARGAVGSRPLEHALHDFRRARQQAALEIIAGRLTGRSLALLSYNDIAAMLKVRGRTERGVQEIPVAAIVGSVGRYNDFTRSFLPRHDWDAQRWTGVKTAGHVADLPPVEVYQIGAAYFVLDGNHRISIARQLGVAYIHAHVVEVHTRVSLSPEVQPDELIIKAEYAAFLEYTRLDDLRPGCDLRVTAPGQYNRLENHIEVHRFFVEMAEERDLADTEAVMRWYDEAYWPLIGAIREQGILRDFPQRTETDLYLWLAEHQAQLRNALGWQIRPDTAVSQIAPHFKPRPMLRKVLDVIVPAGWKGRARSDWVQERLLDRYSRTLFMEILALVTGSNSALEQAIVVAQRENGRVVGLYLGEEEEKAQQAAQQARFNEQCAASGVPAIWLQEAGDVADIICRRAALADLVVLDREGMATTAVDRIWQKCPRPVLLLSGAAAAPAHILLVHDARSQTALFAAAYLAEQWRVQLSVHASETSLPSVQAYLRMHEVEAVFVPEEAVLAVNPAPDWVVVGRNGRDASHLIHQLAAPLLVCP